MTSDPRYAGKNIQVLTLSTIILGIIIILAIVLRLTVPALSSHSVASGIVDSDGKNALGDCPDTPNCQGSESTRTPQRVDRFVVTRNADQAIDTMADIIQSMPGSSVIEQSDRYLHATVATRIMGYVDDIEFLLSDDNLSLQVRSASRLGVSDLGVNARRVAKLRTRSLGKL